MYGSTTVGAYLLRHASDGMQFAVKEGVRLLATQLKLSLIPQIARR